MSGDRIDLKGSFIDTSKPKKRNVSAAEASSPVIGIAISTPAPGSAPAAAAAVANEEIDAPANMLPQNPVVSANAAAEKVLAPAVSKAPATATETLEKTADSGNTSLHE
jgi:hypothetical protein